MVDAEGLSKETLEWLDWYNSLPEEQQLAVSAVPVSYTHLDVYKRQVLCRQICLKKAAL